MNAELAARLVTINNEMMPYGGPRFKYVNAVRDGQRFPVCLMKISKDRYAATASAPGVKIKSLVLRAYGSKPSEAFRGVIRQIEWNLREVSAAELLSKITRPDVLYFDLNRKPESIGN